MDILCIGRKYFIISFTKNIY